MLLSQRNLVTCQDEKLLKLRLNWPFRFFCKFLSGNNFYMPISQTGISHSFLRQLGCNQQIKKKYADMENIIFYKKCAFFVHFQFLTYPIQLRNKQTPMPRSGKQLLVNNLTKSGIPNFFTTLLLGCMSISPFFSFF